MEDHGAFEVAERPGDVGIGGPTVDDDRLAELLGEREVGLEELPLRVVRRVVAVVVQPGLADGDRIEISEPAELRRVGLAGLVGMDPENREHSLVQRAEVHHLPPRFRPGADLEDAVDSSLAGSGDQLHRRFRARVQVRVRVDHAAAAGASTRGKSGCAGSTSSVSTV